ncbi:MAG: 3-deoxy-7-phosphoheptulonate synthase [Anaerorhabdus sp.]
MIVAINKNIPKNELKKLIDHFSEEKIYTNFSYGENYDLIVLLGDLSLIDEKVILANPWVENVQRVGEPYKLASRIYHPEDTTVSVKHIKIGKNAPLQMIAGPCSVEDENVMNEIALRLKNSSTKILRGGAFKPRTSPYSFQGLKEEGVKRLQSVATRNDLISVSEVVDTSILPLFIDSVDILQIGARNMQNFELLKAVGKTNKPVILKRGMSSTIEEWLMSAEYILSSGNPNVILCERGIRTFENSTRSTLDLSAVAVLREKTHLPIIVDPSHATGNWKYVSAMALAAVAAGADGIMLEIHPNPEKAWSDGQQSLRIDRYEDLVKQCKAVASALGRITYED